MSRVAKWRQGGWEASRAPQANRANSPPSDPAPARHVTFQMTGWGDNQANRGVHEGVGKPCAL